MKWCNGDFTLVWCYGDTNMVQWCREYTQVHMVKWWDIVVKWFNNKDLHLIMVKWCNKYGEMVQRIHPSSQGESLKNASRDILFAKWKNCKMVILTFVVPLSHAPLQQQGTSLFLDSVSCCIRCFYISSLWAMPCWLSNRPTSRSNELWCCILSLTLINTFLLCLPSTTSNTGGGGCPIL